MPGVTAVYTGADLIADDIGTLPTLLVFMRPDGKPMTVPPRRLLAHEIVRFAGEPVAAVVATSRGRRTDRGGSDLGRYEVLPSVVDPIEATKPGAPAVWAEAPDNIVAAMSYGDAAAVEAAFANAVYKVSLDLVSQRLVPSAMEPRSSIAEVDKKSGRLILHTQSQTPGSTRDLLAEAVLKRPKESIRVLVGDIGGGFGQKTSLYPERRPGGLRRGQAEPQGTLARRPHRRVRRWHPWPRSHVDRRIRARRQGPRAGLSGALGRRHRGLSLRHRRHHPAWCSVPFVQSGVYDLPLVHYEVKAVMTNTAPVRRLSRRGAPGGRVSSWSG